MDLRIGAKSPVYGARPTIKAGNRELKASFAKAMAETKAANQDTVEISGSPLAKRLDGVHQKIDEMDFAGKGSEEVYRSIIDAYEDEFGFSDLLFYTDRDTYKQVDADRQKLIESAVPNYHEVKSGLYDRAMGYDRMSDAEKIAAINERVGGNTAVHKICAINEMGRAGMLTDRQQLDMCASIRRKVKLDYCEAHGLEYMRFEYPSEYGDDYSERATNLKEKSLLLWTATKEMTWLEVFESIHDYPAMHDWEKDTFFKEIEGITELLTGSDKV